MLSGFFLLRRPGKISTRKRVPDAIVIGRDPAALPAAILLAQADWSVPVREAARKPDEAVLQGGIHHSWYRHPTGRYAGS